MPARHRTQLGQRLFGGVLGASEQLVGAGRVAGQHAPRGAEQDGDRDQPVLGAVVQRALDPAQFGGVRVQGGGAGGGQLGDAQRQVRVRAGGEQPPARPRLQPGHRRGQPDRRGRPAHAEHADRERARPECALPTHTASRGGLALRHEPPPQGEGGVPQGEDRQQHTEEPEKQAEGDVLEQPASSRRVVSGSRSAGRDDPGPRRPSRSRSRRARACSARSPARS